MNVPPEPPARPRGQEQTPGAPQPWQAEQGPAPAADPAYGQPPQPPAHRRRPWAWIVACGFLVVIAAGFAIWALNLNSDLDQQRDETAAAQQQTDAISKQVEDVSNELDQAGDNAKGVLADIKSKLAALIDQIKQDAGNSGGSGNSGGASSATATPAAAETATPSGVEASGTPTP